MKVDRIKLFVVDTGPLITLAAADSLDYLLFIDTGVVIPDAVLYEATHDAMKLGAQDPCRDRGARREDAVSALFHRSWQAAKERLYARRPRAGQKRGA